MPFLLSPGVITTEKDLNNIVPTVSTTSAGFVGTFVWGPVEEITLIESEQTLTSFFGEPDDNTFKYFFTAADYLQYASALKLVRVVGASAKNAVPYSPTSVVGGNSSSSSSSGESSSSSSSGTMSSSSSSSVGKLLSSSSSSNSSSSSALDNSVLVKNRIHYDTLSGLSTGMIAKYPGEMGNSLYVSIADANTYEGWNATIAGTVYDLASEFDSAPGTSSYVSGKGGSNDEMHIIIIDADGTITGTIGTVLEKFAYVSKAKDAKRSDGTNNYYKNVLNDTSAYVWWASHPALVNWGGVGSLSFTQLTVPVAHDFDGGFTDNANITNSEILNGYSMFVDVETVDVSMLMGGPGEKTVADYIIGLCETRGDCIATISPAMSDVVNVLSKSTQTTNVVNYRNTLPSTSYAVLDSGWKYRYDRYNDEFRWVPLNGDVAGLMARVDVTNDPWFSPGGPNNGQIKNVSRLAFNPEKTHRDELYKKGVNPVVTFAGEGTMLFGDRTMLSRPSSFREIGIRRLFIFLRKSIKQSSKFSLFQFNDFFTRSQFKSTVEPFLDDVKGRRGLEDFKVVADESNNTAEVQSRQEFIGDIYIKPLHSINFIQLNFISVRSGVSFSEVGG